METIERLEPNTLMEQAQEITEQSEIDSELLVLDNDPNLADDFMEFAEQRRADRQSGTGLKESYDNPNPQDNLKVYVSGVSADLLTFEQEQMLGRRKDQGDQAAMQELVEGNLRLVMFIAKKYASKNPDISIMDIIQEGNLGLIRAAEKFDHSLGYKFSTYATWWIRNSIGDCLSRERRNQLPRHIFDQIHSMRKAKVELEQQLGRSPSSLEMAKAMGLSLKKFEQLEQYDIKQVSLNSPISEDNNATRLDFLADESQPTPEEQVLAGYEAGYEKDKLEWAISKLEHRYQLVIRLRYGLDDDNPKSLDEIANYLGVTRERVRQIEVRAIKKLELALRGADELDYTAFAGKNKRKLGNLAVKSAA